jgi:hypothetical protein
VGYKILGYVVWQGGKRYVRRRVRAMQRQLVVTGAAALIAAVGVAVLSARRGSDSK